MSSQKITTKFGDLAACKKGSHAIANTASRRRQKGFIGVKPSARALGRQWWINDRLFLSLIFVRAKYWYHQEICHEVQENF